MKVIQNIQEVNEMVDKQDMAIIYFTGTACGVCEVIKEKIERILENYPAVICGEINGEAHLDIAAQYQVFTLPHMVLFVQEKEAIRAGKHIDLMELENKINRYYEMMGLKKSK